MSFQKNKYKIIRNIISKEFANFVMHYALLQRDAINFMINKNIINSANPLAAIFVDSQVPNSYAKYADHVMETLLVMLLPTMKEKTKLDLIPTYSYYRIYNKGNILKRHTDRPSCEISTTLNLGGDPWSIFLDPSGKKGKKGVEVKLEPGDMLIYQGCVLEHWRETFNGNFCVQVFLHYNNLKGKYGKTNLFDKRPLLGIPQGKYY
jgi:hypothetical protein